MIYMQQTMIDLQKMSYQMSVNMVQSMMMLPLAFVILTLVFTAGIQFALILPLMPFIMFWAGQTSWVFSVIEAMIAAPLIGFALLLPGGHGAYGHSIPAIRMMLNVVLKPVLIVFGTIASMILIYIVIVYSAQGFHMIGDGIVNTFYMFNNGVTDSGLLKQMDRVTNIRAIFSLMLIFVYATFLMMVFEKCFSTIYILPERVVQWLGGQASSAGKDEAQKMAQTTTQQAGQVAQAGQQATQSVAAGSKEMSDAKASAARGIGDTFSQTASSADQVAAISNQQASTEQSIAQAESDAGIGYMQTALEATTGAATAIKTANINIIQQFPANSY